MILTFTQNGRMLRIPIILNFKFRISMKNKLFLIVLLTIFYTGCSHNTGSGPHNHEADSADNGHDHTHENVKIQLTAYSDNFEVFAEADPFVVGKEGNILTHFSSLPDFRALENASVTIRLTVNGKIAIQKLSKPTRKGIYSFNIKPAYAGLGELQFDIKTENDKFQVIVKDVEVFADEHDAIHKAEEAELPTINTVVFTKEQSWKIDFATEEVKQEPFGQVIKTTAQVQPAQGDEILVSAKTNGIVQFLSANIIVGEPVSNGLKLFSISGKGLADNNAEVRFAEAKSNFEKEKSDYERLQELAHNKIVSEKELVTARNHYENAKAIYDNLNRNFNASGQSVNSPLSGFVKQLFVENGQYVEAGQVIVSVSQNKSLVLRAEVQQKYAPILSRINTANIRSPHSNQRYTLEELNGKILSFGKTTNSDNYLIPVSLQIDNNGHFVPGSFVEVYLKTLTYSEALTIPNSALLEEQGNFFVFVQITPELFEKHEVKSGATDGLKTEIIKGLNLGDRIVNKGAILIKLAQATGTLDAHSGHVH